jgi:hypothetical protein
MGKKTVDVGLGEAATITPFQTEQSRGTKEAASRIGIFTSRIQGVSVVDSLEITPSVSGICDSRGQRR